MVFVANGELGFKDYLSNRKQLVKYYNIRSTEK